MKNFKNFSKKLLKNRAGQGATEYILLLVVIVGLVMLFGNDIKGIMTEKIGNLKNSIMQVE